MNMNMNMKRKNIFLVIVLVTLIAFGTVSTAGAVVDPVTLCVVGLGVVTVASYISEKLGYGDEAPAAAGDVAAAAMEVQAPEAQSDGPQPN